MEEIDTNCMNATGKIECNFHWWFNLLTNLFSVRITTSVYPVPSICRFDQLGDWFESLADILHWNLRKSQVSWDGERSRRNSTDGLEKKSGD